MTNAVTIYGRDACPYCERAREHLASRNIPFSYVNLTNEPGRREELSKRLGYAVDTVPKVFIRDELVGGFTDLAMLPERHLQAMVGGA